jgi:hypothetical protein
MPSVNRTIVVVALLLIGQFTTAWLPGRLSLVSLAYAQQSANVWVNTESGVYHCPTSRYYGKTRTGVFMAEPEALAAGHRPAYGRRCTTGAVGNRSVPPQPLRTDVPAPTPTRSVRVWVNLRSGVYHCPGSRYYGNTKTGKYMTETKARAAGNRPANDRPCS